MNEKLHETTVKGENSRFQKVAPRIRHYPTLHIDYNYNNYPLIIAKLSRKTAQLSKKGKYQLVRRCVCCDCKKSELRPSFHCPYEKPHFPRIFRRFRLIFCAFPRIIYWIVQVSDRQGCENDHSDAIHHRRSENRKKNSRQIFGLTIFFPDLRRRQKPKHRVGRRARCCQGNKK